MRGYCSAEKSESVEAQARQLTKLPSPPGWHGLSARSVTTAFIDTGESGARSKTSRQSLKYLDCELEPAIGLKARNAWSVAIARAAGFRMLVMSRIRHAAIRLGPGQKERPKYPEKSLSDNNSWPIGEKR
jgi:hypothetical protein